MFLFYIHHPFFLGKGEFIAKIQIYVGLRIRFYLFSTYNLKIWYFFRKTSSFFLALKKNQQFFLELRKITNSYLNLKFFSKTHQSSLSLKRSSKTHQSSLNLKGGSTAFPKPLFSWRRLAALGNVKADFHCAHLHNLSPQGTGDVPTALLGAQTATL